MAKNNRALSRGESLGLATPMIRWTLAVTATTAVIVILFFALFAKDQAHSAMTGAGIAFIATGYAVRRVFSLRGEQLLEDSSGAATLAGLYRAEFGKLVITGALCAGAFAVVKDLEVVGFLVGLVATLLSATFGAILAQVSEEKRRSRRD